MVTTGPRGALSPSTESEYGATTRDDCPFDIMHDLGEPGPTSQLARGRVGTSGDVFLTLLSRERLFS